MKRYTTPLIKFLAGLFVGYSLSQTISHPEKGRARKHIPQVHIGRVQLTPELLIKRETQHIHLHHWATIPSLYVLLIALRRSLKNNHFLTGVVTGTTLQGLRYKDRFQFRKALENVEEVLEEKKVEDSKPEL